MYGGRDQEPTMQSRFLRTAVGNAKRLRRGLSGDDICLMVRRPVQRTERYGFVPLDVLGGTTAQRPESIPMFLPLGSVPRRR